jgi:cold shock CspA family protein/predicted type IV restriction endonuclease
VHIDEAHERFRLLHAEIKADLENILTEAEARLKIINRLLTEVLGWRFEDIRAEPHSPEGFTDYLLSIEKRASFVVEAKRVEKLLINTVNESMSSYKASGPGLNAAEEALKQTAAYCLDHGVKFAAITTGDVWIFFNAFPGDGRSYRDARAVTFPSLDAVEESFAEFFDLASKEGVSEKRYLTLFAKADGVTLRHLEPLVAVNREGDRHLLPRSELALDLDAVFAQFFGDLSGDADPDMLTDCFVESRESRVADAALQKLIANVSASVTTMDAGTGGQLASKIEVSVDTGRGDNVLIVGNKGSGKSTFIDRFFKSVLVGDLRAKCFVVRLDFTGSTGDPERAVGEATADARLKIEAQLYREGAPTYDELQGLYYSEYQKRRTGQFRHQYSKDKEQFKIDFGNFLDEQMSHDTFSYVCRMLEDVVKNRHLMPVIIFDNTDHHSIPFQEAIFQWSQAIRKAIPYSLVIIPITDRTVWRLSKHGPFQTYQTKTFYLPVPSTKEILARRVSYLSSKASSQPGSNQYFLKKGIRLSIENIHAFAVCMEEILIQEDFISRRISWLTNHDVRRGLRLSQEVITSPMLSIDSLVGAYMTHGKHRSLTLKPRKFMQALLLSGYNAYSGDHDFVMNVFSVSEDLPSTPLLVLSILKLLIDRQSDDTISAGGYFEVGQIITYLSAMQLDEDAARAALRTLLDRRLVEPYDAADDQLIDAQRVAVTHSGRMHYEFAFSDHEYFTQMALNTPIRDIGIVDQIRDIKSKTMFPADWDRLRSLFAAYCLDEDRSFSRVPNDDMFDGQKQLRQDIEARWVSGNGVAKNSVNAASADEPTENVHDRIDATVIRYDSSKGFGFADAGLGEDVYLPGRLLNDFGSTQPPPGSKIVCDVAPGKAGKLQAVAIYSVEESSKTGSFIPGQLKFFDSRKGFGFVVAEGMQEDIYLPASVLNEAGVYEATEGTPVEVIVGPRISRRGAAATAIRLVG